MSQGLPVWMKTEEQLAAVEKFQPDIMILHAGVLRGFVTIWERTGYTLSNLKHCRNISDTVDQELRDRFRAVSGLEIEDNYSCSETGTIAIQCPVSGLYHTMMETLVVEVLDKDGNECKEGEEGRIVVTDLYNTATPLIRYDIGDYAIVGGECGCGRNHKTFTKVLGRERNLLKLPDGTRFWPRAGRYEMQKVANIRQWQIVQHSYEDVEFKIVTDEAITEEQETELKSIFSKAINDFACVRITRYEQAIPPNKGGKFEESVCLVD
jgi:phenylacetate-CoA ligase